MPALYKSSGENRDECLSFPRLPRDSLLENSLVTVARSCPYVNWRNTHTIYTIHSCSHVDLVREYYFQGNVQLTKEAVFVYTFAYTHTGT